MRSSVWSYHDLFVDIYFFQSNRFVLILQWRWFNSILMPYLSFKSWFKTDLPHIFFFFLEEFSQNFEVSSTQSESMILRSTSWYLVFQRVNAILNEIYLQVSNPRVFQTQSQELKMFNFIGPLVNLLDSFLKHKRNDLIFHIISSTSIPDTPTFCNFFNNSKSFFIDISHHVLNKSTTTCINWHSCRTKKRNTNWIFFEYFMNNLDSCIKLFWFNPIFCQVLYEPLCIFVKREVIVVHDFVKLNRVCYYLEFSQGKTAYIFCSYDITTKTSILLQECLFWLCNFAVIWNLRIEEAEVLDFFIFLVNSFQKVWKNAFKSCLSWR